MSPLEDGIQILGASSDHLICDITNAERKISVGDKISFNMLYTATMRSFTSKYIDKYYIE